MQHPASVPGLTKCLENTNEVDMVRHECAEALGSIATDNVLQVLQKYRNDSQIVVKESCQVALDIYDYETSGDLHYATMKEQLE
jgi:deoxyhypusine monooxygenase